jgi:cobalt-zinc-cadmium efflux system membrane fusion protein
VVSTHFHLGDRVERGKTMAVIRSVELSEMEAERKSLEAEIAILQRELESVQSMYHDNLVSQRELLEAQGQLKQTEASLEMVRINLSLYGSSGSDGTFIIKSPISGFVVERDITAGMQIAAESDPLFVVADISRVWIIANVYAGDLALVKEGMPVDIRTSAYPGEVFNGKIDVMSQVFDPEEHVLKARIVMPNNDLRLKPEMAVDITLRDSREKQMAVIPSKALIFDKNRYFVVKQTASDIFTITEVALYAQTNGISYIETGLNAGDKVVVKDNLLMYSRLKE